MVPSKIMFYLLQDGCMSIYLSIYLSIHLSIYVSACNSLSLSLCVSRYLYRTVYIYTYIDIVCMYYYYMYTYKDPGTNTRVAYRLWFSSIRLPHPCLLVQANAPTRGFLAQDLSWLQGLDVGPTVEASIQLPILWSHIPNTAAVSHPAMHLKMMLEIIWLQLTTVRLWGDKVGVLQL